MTSRNTGDNCLSFEGLEKKLLMASQPLEWKDGLDRNLDLLHSVYISDGFIDRREAISILKHSQNYDTITSIEISHLQKIFQESEMPDYVRYLGNSVVTGSPANNQFQGETLGNLYAGSNAAHMEKLIDKWFLGKDYPGIDYWAEQDVSYELVSGKLFLDGHETEDIKQGEVGDCYFITALVAFTSSQKDKSAIPKMFVNNGDNTWTVRFYDVRDNFREHYVTVDRNLPVKNGKESFFADYGKDYSDQNNELWVALAEKAYVQFSTQIPGVRENVEPNQYFSITTGNVSVAIAQIKGGWNGWYRFNDTQRVIDDLSSGRSLSLTYNRHTYTIISYDTDSEKFFFYNPYGRNHMFLSWDDVVEKKINGAPLIPGVSTGSVNIEDFRSNYFGPAFFVSVNSITTDLIYGPNQK